MCFQFFSKNVIFLYILKIFFNRVTLENIFEILNNSVYFQNVVVCNKSLIDTTAKVASLFGLLVKLIFQINIVKLIMT